MRNGPFAPYPADADAIDRLAEKISSNGTALASVGDTTVAHGRRAGSVESVGFEDAVHTATQPSVVDGNALSTAATSAKTALNGWASEVRVYDSAMETLNSLWEVAKADNFGVDAAGAGTVGADGGDPLETARSATFAVLKFAKERAQERLDGAAVTTAAMIDGDSGSNVRTLAYVQNDGYNPYGSWGSAMPNSGVQQVGLFGDIWDGVTEGFKFLVGDPAECFSDDATPGGCGLEAAAMLPWFKPLKLLKLGKLGKGVDEAPKPKPDPEPKPKPKPKGPPTVHEGKQGKHIPGHKNFQKGKSELEADPAELAKRAGEGTPVNNVPFREAGYKERIDYGEPIGKYVDPKTSEAIETTKAILHYAKDGSVHIVPARP